jgi:hypothetical protein
MESAPPVTTRTVVSKASDRVLRLLYERPLLVLTMMFCTGGRLSSGITSIRRVPRPTGKKGT